ncbi:hypothetical protein GCM10008170_36900 [Methylopila capsulata]|uniref:Uncharacterized protein n=1 Tax=Methylopila capsulata TaxID=61654 RepID=A0A9W6MTC9_9HYPH|nr:hypothetical protein GCM10008170_36900 [Methylopila capsulata]
MAQASQRWWDKGLAVSVSLPLAGRVRVGVAQKEASRMGDTPRSILHDPHPRPLPARGRGEARRASEACGPLIAQAASTKR